MDIATLLTGIGSAIGGGTVVKTLAHYKLKRQELQQQQESQAREAKMKEESQAIEGFEKLTNRHESEICELKSECKELRNENEQIRNDHVECMEQHAAAQRELGEMRGRVAELRDLAHAAVGLKQVVNVMEAQTQNNDAANNTALINVPAIQSAE